MKGKGKICGSTLVWCGKVGGRKKGVGEKSTLIGSKASISFHFGKFSVNN
jgi:hypothetical protein